LDRTNLANLAGLTIEVEPPGMPPYFLYNTLQFRVASDHAQDPTEPPYSSINAPLHKFRWLHVPGLAHQGLTPIMGTYRYTVPARFFDGHGSLLPMDSAWSVSEDVDVVPFEKNGLSLGFTRGFTQSQAFIRRFGPLALIRPDDDTLLFDTTQVAGADAFGKQYTFEDEYVWSGFTARVRILEVLDEVLTDPSLRVDVLAYDLNEPGVVGRLLRLAQQGRIRMVLDSSSLHHSTSDPKPEDEFETLFTQAAQAGAEIIRGRSLRPRRRCEQDVGSVTTRHSSAALRTVPTSCNHDWSPCCPLRRGQSLIVRGRLTTTKRRLRNTPTSEIKAREALPSERY
jgi:hypothetical protein